MILSDLAKSVDSVISNLSVISKQKPIASHPASAASAHTPAQQDGEEAEKDKAEEKAANSLKRNEKLRAMLEFHIPTDTLVAQKVTEANLIAYLGMIEQKANELLTLNYVVNNYRKVVLTGDQDVLIPAGGVSGLIGQGNYSL